MPMIDVLSATASSAHRIGEESRQAPQPQLMEA